MAREAWQDGKLVAKIDADVLLQRGFRGGSWFPFILNVGKWQSGKLHYGDMAARRSASDTTRG